jgi:aspartate/methionine/tyrosine aminotransferase
MIKTKNEGVSKSLGLPGARIGWLATTNAPAAQSIAELKVLNLFFPMSFSKD